MPYLFQNNVGIFDNRAPWMIFFFILKIGQRMTTSWINERFASKGCGPSLLS